LEGNSRHKNIDADGGGGKTKEVFEVVFLGDGGDM